VDQGLRRPADPDLRGAALILHLTSHAEWLAAQQDGEYRAASLQTEGFIHCSTEQQIVQVANSFYPGRHGLVLLEIDLARLKPELRWEPPAHPTRQTDQRPAEEVFPHIYGPLNTDAVLRVIEFEPDSDGRFSLPIL
jgi:uncharacterized protein (DUF952 family)